MTDLRSDLRLLIARYGLPTVHQALQSEMRETFEYLRQMYEPPKNNLVIPVAEVIPDRVATPHHRPLPSAVNEMEVPSLDLESSEESHPEESSPKNSDPTLKEVVIQAKKEMGVVSEEKFSKVKHKEDVAKKYKELCEKGIKPEDLLTKDNLTTWLAQGMSYMRIARELTGIPDNQIAAIAKNFGLQSDVRKYVVMKKGGK